MEGTVREDRERERERRRERERDRQGDKRQNSILHELLKQMGHGYKMAERKKEQGQK